MIALNSHKIEIKHVAIIMDGNGRWAKKNKISKKMDMSMGCVIVLKFVKI
mgnify:CR=1 FL=1